MATNKDATEVRVWRTANFYKAPLDTAAPTGTGALAPAFTGLGYLVDAEIAETTNQTETPITIYEGLVVRNLITAGSYSLGFGLSQTTLAVTEEWYGATTADGSIIFDPLAEKQNAVYVLDLFDGNSFKRIVMPNGQASRNGNVTFSAKAATDYPFLFTGFSHSSLEYGDQGAQGVVRIYGDELVATPAG